MHQIYSDPLTKAQLHIGDIHILNTFSSVKKLIHYTFIRTQKNKAQILVDHTPVTLKPNQIISLNPNQQLTFVKGDDAIIYQFNREFYCIKDHDKEVNCMGVLFFSHNETPLIQLNAEENKKFNNLHKEILEEFEQEDSIQAEMLQLLLKKFIIKATRLIKKNNEYFQKMEANEPEIAVSKQELLRNFNVLVEEFYRTEHQVSFYADKLFKAPKTLSNTFNSLHTSPLQIIHKRIVLETKRLLLYSDKSFKEIAYDLGYSDASHLSRLFKNHTQIAPSQFKKKTIK